MITRFSHLNLDHAEEALGRNSRKYFIYSKYAGATVLAVTSFHTINATAIQISDALINLPTEPETNLPKLDLGNGDLVLFETAREYGFTSTHAVSHIKRS